MNYRKLKRLSAVLHEEAGKQEFSGAAIRVLHHDEIVYEEEVGFADIEKGIPIAKDTIYRLFSQSKPVTAMAAMILYERGQLNLMAPVSEYLEGFQNQRVLTAEYETIPVTNPVTVRDLLNMTSGIPYPDESFEAGRRMKALFDEVESSYHQNKKVGTVEFANRIGQVPLEFEPGERWRYGASADVLSAVIEVVSGCSFGTFLKEEIFNPLGMEDTGFYVPEEKLHRFAQIYDLTEDRRLIPFTGDKLAIFDYHTPPAFESGGAGLVSTMNDYTRFAMMLANRGSYDGVRILGHKTVEFLSKPQLTASQSITYDWEHLRGYGYGNLMRIMVNPAAGQSNGSVGEFGWSGWTGNYFMVDPTEDMVMLYMIQRAGGITHDALRKLCAIIYGAI